MAVIAEMTGSGTRSGRPLPIVLLPQSRDAAAAREIAWHPGVSVRAVYRDIGPADQGHGDRGQRVAADDLIAVVEAMQMQNPVVAHQAGTVTGLWVVPGDGTMQDQELWELI
jgi:hypothetical protein